MLNTLSNYTVTFTHFLTCSSSSYKGVKTAHLGDLLSECTLSLSPMLREARDKLETEKTRWREPGCETRCTTQHDTVTPTPQ